MLTLCGAMYAFPTFIFIELQRIVWNRHQSTMQFAMTIGAQHHAFFCFVNSASGHYLISYCKSFISNVMEVEHDIIIK